MQPSSRDPNWRARRAFTWFALGGVLAGCGEGTVPIVGFAHPTLVEVSPDDFLGDVSCVDAPGAMRRYVATVFDVGPAVGAGGESSGGAENADTTGFAFPSSTVVGSDRNAVAIPCTQSVGFSHVVPGNKYRAEVDGYDRDDLIALAAGLRVMVDPLTLERVAPRWTTSCGKPPVTSRRFIVRRIGGCEPLVDSAEPGGTLVEVRLDGALGMLECGTADGAVDRFEVIPPGGTAVSATCGETMTLTGLEPGRATLSLPLRAFEAGALEPTWGTTCLVEVVQGLTSVATCLPLSSTGVLEVDPLDALAALGLPCEAGAFAELEVAIEAETEVDGGAPEPLFVPPTACGRALRFQGREVGPATARATARFSDGTRSPAALCTATIAPGETAVATCAREP
jgi:hypothetical protein